MSDRDRNQTITAVLALVNADRWSTTQEVLIEHKDQLWGEQADEVFTELVNQHEADAGALAQINWSWDILKAARQKGIPGAQARAQGKGARFVVPAEVVAELNEIIESGDQDALNDLVDRHPYIVTVLENLDKQEEAEG